MELEKSKILSKTLADIYLEQGHIEEAIEIYEKLSKRFPKDEFYRQRLSSLKVELKEKINRRVSENYYRKGYGNDIK